MFGKIHTYPFYVTLTCFYLFFLSLYLYKDARFKNDGWQYDKQNRKTVFGIHTRLHIFSYCSWDNGTQDVVLKSSPSKKAWNYFSHRSISRHNVPAILCKDISDRVKICLSNRRRKWMKNVTRLNFLVFIQLAHRGARQNNFSSLFLWGSNLMLPFPCASNMLYF